ncbi:endonuclease/exonuclease/phosphatase family protein [Massilia glaciei]|uniref:Endonuclease n=1 Tax=Massilia glaciei TaxID=1524097 RepID=A0A2U2HEP7_9BURK|nr:endonuclease/exonuclease/phosphatase family protein [Massilia glaciei]PWF42092.1 endonuclease [Massilia glaciei]
MKIITWNMQRGRGTDGVADLGRAVAMLRAFSDFDVLCLQEVACGYTDLDGYDGSDQFAEMATLLPGYTALNGKTDDANAHPPRAFGNMMFSRYPVLQACRHSLPWPAEDGVMSMQRGALEATVDTPSGPLRVCTTHLEYFSPRQRAAQVERLRELHVEAIMHARTSRPGLFKHGPFAVVPRAAAAVLTGDCNFLPDSTDHARLLAPFDDASIPPYLDAWALAHPGQAHAPTVGLHDASPEPDRPFTIDYIYLSADLAPRVRRLEVHGDATGSAHQPVLLELG